MAIGGIILAFSVLYLDQSEVAKTGELSWLYRGGPEGGRGLLSSVASSMVTVAATAFSITIVALQLASSNFGPRLLRNFMQDTGNQVVLGTFIATFLYCLLVLRTIHGEDYNLFIPNLSITIGIVLAIASIGVLIYFIHHASTIIQASHVIAGVVADLEKATDRLYPEEIGQDQAEAQPSVGEIPQYFEARANPIPSNCTGYLQAIDQDLLLKIAYKSNLLVRLQVQPGMFVIEGNPFALAYPQERVNSQIVAQLQQTLLVGKERTEQQDIAFPLTQLVEIALRALSPGINDPFTAMRCVDRLSAGLSHLAQRQFPSAYRYDNHHQLRVVAEPVTFAQLLDTAFNQICHYGQSDAAVMLQLLQAIEKIAAHTKRPSDRWALQQQADLILQASQEGIGLRQDLQLVETQYDQVMVSLRSGCN